MNDLRWLDLSLADMQGIFDYISLDNRERAASFIAEIEAEALKLCDFPLLGVHLNTFDPGHFRALHYKGYSIVYKVLDNEVVVYEVCQQSKYTRRVRIIR